MSLTDPEPPQRWSVDDPDWRPGVARCIDILLNGVPQRNVIAYDCPAGLLTRYVLTNNGWLLLNPEGDALVEQTVTGVVAAVWNANRPRFMAQMAMFRRMLRVGELMCLAGNRPGERRERRC